MTTNTQTGTVLVTGANRGLGLEFARQYAAEGWTVIATARNPRAAETLQGLASTGRLTIETLDVSQLASIHALAARLADRPIDLLLHNAAVLGDQDKQSYGRLDFDEFQQVMNVNVYGVLALTDALRAQVLSSTQKKVVGVTSGAGIISKRAFDGVPYYCISKSALNRALQSLAANLAPAGATVGLIAPGVADTDMRRALVGELAAKDNTPQAAVAAMRKVIAGMTPENTNTVWNFDGTELPW